MKDTTCYKGKGEKAMSVTIKDVAHLANVAPSTVSRVIANNPRISQKTKVRVREAMKELGYHPNFIARSLANQSTQILGLVLPTISEAFFTTPIFTAIVRGLSEGAREKNYSILMNTGKSEEEIYDGVVEMVQGGMVDGIVLAYSQKNDAIISYLQSRDFPFVLIGNLIDVDEDMIYVDNDNFAAGKEVTEYLLNLGHEKIAFIGGHLQVPMTRERLLGYDAALKEHGILPSNDYRLYDDLIKDGAPGVVKRLLALPVKPTALVVSDDMISIGIVNNLMANGISVPEQMSIISFNDAHAELSFPALTTINLNIFDLGYEAANCLIKMLATPSEPVKSPIIPHQIVERDSCKKVKKAQLASTS